MVAVIARRVKALTADGAIAAAAVGFIVFGWGGMAAAWPLLVFFGSATYLTRRRARFVQRSLVRQIDAGSSSLGGAGSSSPGRRRVVKLPAAAQGRQVWPGAGATPNVAAVEKAAHRDADGRKASQVLANGGVAAATVLAAALWPDPMWAAAYGGAVATSAADTWATELGMSSRRRPVLITTLKPVTPGQSGGVSGAGTVAGAAGAALIGVVLVAVSGSTAATSLTLVDVSLHWAGIAVAGGGFLGMLADSVIGATLQARFRCPACQRPTEHARHYCRPEGVQTTRIGGLPGLDNDGVNLTATVVGAAAAAVLFRILA